MFGSPVIKFDRILSGRALEQCAVSLCPVSVCICIFSRSSIFLHSEEAENLIPSELLRNDASNVKPASWAGSPRTRHLWWHFQREPGFSKRLKPFSNYPQCQFVRFQVLTSKFTSFLEGCSRSDGGGWRSVSFLSNDDWKASPGCRLLSASALEFGEFSLELLTPAVIPGYSRAAWV